MPKLDFDLKAAQRRSGLEKRLFDEAAKWPDRGEFAAVLRSVADAVDPVEPSQGTFGFTRTKTTLRENGG